MTLFTPHPPQPSPQPLNCQEVGEPTPLDSEGRDPATTVGWPCCRPSAIIWPPWFPSSDTHRLPSGAAEEERNMMTQAASRKG